MEKNYVVVNIGSASKKYAVYQQDQEILRAHFEREGDTFVLTKKGEKEAVSQESYENSFAYLMPDFGSIAAIGVRVVAPGEYFLEHRVVDDVYLDMLSTAYESAPLHIGLVLEEVKKIKNLNLGVPMIGVSDSVFHKDLPLIAQTYAIPRVDARAFGIRRYGYHGISLASLVDEVALKRGGIPDRMIICHLGGGASITALKGGKSFDTSMGFTPLEGLVMATRSGDIDPGAMIYLAEKKGLGMHELEAYLNHQAGLLGMSGTSDDIRVLLEREALGDADAALALGVYVLRIKKYIGAYTAILGGLDVVVFSGTVGERSQSMRERICQGLGALGITLDQEANTTEGIEGAIQSSDARVQVLVLKTDEMQEIFREVKKIT